MSRPVAPDDEWSLAAFVASLRARDLSPATLRAYRGDLERFISWSAERALTGPSRITRRTLRDYLATMNREGDERTSIARRRASLRAYFAWALERGLIDEDPAARVSAPRPNSAAPGSK